ncbi:hypothetical protein BDV96DRAFT_639414 [Lophiotrema nucula]|uniref:Rhodopsin domain-containing protein n=1 Tax=Lophiotrema nucula TaxID=690887 RepID=A0A6A5ZUA9_9PLEO|nr:hypothetical protein BDV96DRAFT_639414 [Lophiotrema nucula]
MSLMLVAVTLRVYARAIVVRTFGFEDWACLFAAVLNVGYAAVAFIALSGPGLGIHMWDMHIGDIMHESYFKTLIASQSLYPVVLLFTKLSILLLVYRIFWADKKARVMVWFGIAVNTIFYFITFVLTVVWCAPPAGGNPMLSAAKPSCQTDVHRMTVVQSGFNIGSDLYLVIIPIPLVAGLKMSWGRKVRVSFVFGLGLLATILSALNLYYRVLSLRTIDTSWAYIPVYICSIFELNIGVICTCLPCFPALFKTEGMKNLFSLRSWSIFSSISSSRSRIFKRSTEKGDYSDMTSLKDIQSSGKEPSLTERSLELRDHGYLAREQV